MDIFHGTVRKSSLKHRLDNINKERIVHWADPDLDRSQERVGSTPANMTVKLVSRDFDQVARAVEATIGEYEIGPFHQKS